MIEIVYTWPSGRQEVRYRRVAGSREAGVLIAQVEILRNQYGEATPYSWRVQGKGGSDG